MIQLNNFDKMWDAYPNPGESAEAAKQTVGGRAVAGKIDNTCVLRISRAFNYSGNPIPGTANDEILTIKGGDGRNYALRVREFTRYLKRKYGPPDLVKDYPRPGSGEIPEAFMGRQGVIIFDVKGWTDATGHADLWNGTKCRHHGYFNKASSVMLWLVDDELPHQLSSSVGQGGANQYDDVTLVQNMLADNGIDPGAVDGACGPKTIAAVREFQGRFLTNPDGRIDPGGRTWNELLGL